MYKIIYGTNNLPSFLLLIRLLVIVFILSLLLDIDKILYNNYNLCNIILIIKNPPDSHSLIHQKDFINLLLQSLSYLN